MGRSTREEEFRRALTPAFVQGLRLIALALGVGVTVMLLSAVGLAGFLPSEGQDVAAGTRVVLVCSIVHAALAVILFGLAAASPRKVWSRMPARRRSDASGHALDSVRAVFIVRLVLCEAAALFGVVVCILGATLGVLRAHPLYWLNAGSALILLAFIAATFPDEDRLVALYQRLAGEPL
jgi:hypothetical protein